MVLGVSLGGGGWWWVVVGCGMAYNNQYVSLI